MSLVNQVSRRSRDITGRADEKPAVGGMIAPIREMVISVLTDIPPFGRSAGIAGGTRDRGK